jgi:hypothetical protein
MQMLVNVRIHTYIFKYALHLAQMVAIYTPFLHFAYST